MIIFAKVRISIDYKIFILLNVHPADTFIQESLSRLVKDKTVIIIAHRMRTVAGADKIVVLKEGKVDECGSPSELTASGGFYKRMQDLQRNALEWNI